jgi:hypothetical protein
MVALLPDVANLRNWWNIDALGYLRERYKNPMFAIRLGYTAVRNCLRDQLAATKVEGLENIGSKSSLRATNKR